MQNRVRPITEPTSDQGSPFLRIILADRHEITRVGIRRILGAEDDIRVVAQAANASQLISSLTKFPCDAVLLSASTLDKPQELLYHLREKYRDLPVILVMDEDDHEQVLEYYRLGVRGVLAHDVSADLLVKCIRKVVEGEIWISQRAISQLIDSYRASARHVEKSTNLALSTKHQRILSLVVRGFRNREIAREIGTSEQVIKNDLRKLYQRFGVADRLELVLYVLHNNILQSQNEEQTA